MGHYIAVFVGGYTFGGVVAAVVTWMMLRRRRARKRLVAAALDVINNYRLTINKPYPVSQFKDRCDLALVMRRLIDATNHVN
jgi:alpha/beta superfamily hydrolase